MLRIYFSRNHYYYDLKTIVKRIFFEYVLTVAYGGGA